MACFINYRDLLHDEICLEGRCGISIDGLWSRITERVGISPPQALKIKLWNMIKTLRYVEFLVECDKKERAASTEDERRKDVSKKIKEMSLDDCVKVYGSKMKMVASKLARWKALAPNHLITQTDVLTPSQYDLFEKIGRSRNLGEKSFNCDKTTSKSKDEDYKAAKAAFYLRKTLLMLRLIWQENTVSSSKALIRFRLCRFRKHMSRLNLEEERHINIIKKMLEKHSGRVSFVDLKKELGIAPKQLKFWLKSKFPFSALFDIVAEFINNRRRNYVIARPQLSDTTKPEESGLNDNCDWEATFHPADVEDDSDTEPTQPYQAEEEEDGPWNRDVVLKRRHKQPILRQAYLAIASFGPEGATLLEISKSLGYGWRLGRSACRFLVKSGAIKTYMVDYGKLRYARYYAKCFQQTSKTKTDFDIEYERLSQNLLKFSVPNFESNTLQFNKIVDQMTVTLTVIEKNLPDEDLMAIMSQAMAGNKSNVRCSLRYIARTNILLEVLNMHEIICELYQLKKISFNYQVQINDRFSAMELIDRKILYKQLQQMQSLNLVKLYDVKIKYKNEKRTRLIMCKPQLKITEVIIKKILDNDLRALYLSDREKQNRLTGANLFEQRVPKMERNRIIHEFMYQLAWGHSQGDESLNEEIVPVISQLNASMMQGGANKNTTTETQKEIKLGDHDRTLTDTRLTPIVNICLDPPVGWPQGWIRVSDAINCMPQSMFLQLSTMNKPSLVTSAIYAAIFFLSNMGLTYFDNSKEHVYINKYATIIEKTDHLKREHKFNFDALRALKIYWDFLRNMCLKHKDTINRNKLKKNQKIVRTTLIKLLTPTIGPHEAPLFDNGSIPGNGCGFAGFDSSMVVTKKISWHRHISTITTKECPKRKRPCLPRDSSPALPKKKRKRLPKQKPFSGFRLRAIPKDSAVKKRIDLSLPRRKLVWKPEELHLIFLARIAGSLILIGKGVSGRIACHMQSILITICERIFITAGIHSIIRPFIMRRLKLLSANRQIQRILDVKLTEAKDIVAFREYIGMYHKLRSVTSKVSDAKRKLILVTLELILGLHHAQVIKSNSSIKVFDSFETIHRTYNIISNKKTKPESFDKPLNSNEIEAVTIQNAAVAVLGSADELNWTPILAKVKEENLRSAVKALQSQGIVALRNKFYRLSQNYMTTVAPLNAATIELQMALEDVAGERVKVVSCGSDNIPCFEETNLKCPVTRAKTRVNNVSKLGSLITCLKNEIAKTKDVGCSGDDIKVLLQKYNRKQLCCTAQQHFEVRKCVECLTNIEQCLKRLTDDKTVYKVGNDTIRWALHGYETAWTIGGVHPQPWIRADGSTSDSSFFRWMGTVLWCILEQPGISCMELSTRLRLLRPTQMITIISKLEEIGSVRRQTLDVDDFGLTSSEDCDMTLRPSLEFDSLESIFVIPATDAISLYEEFKKTIPCVDTFDSKIEIA